MAENSDFVPQRVLGGDLSKCEPGQILELTKKLCRIAAAECGENGYRGGFRPGNIYVAEDGRVAVGAAGRPGENGWTKLELEFIAPELFWNGEKSAATDVYSIALILYAGLNGGRLPFIDTQELSDEQRAGALRRRLSGDGFAMPEGIDDKLSAIVSKALSFEPKKRYADTYELLCALLEYSGDEPEVRPGKRPAVIPQTEKPKQPERPKPEEKLPQPEKTAPKKKEEPKDPEPKAENAAEPVKEKMNIHQRRSARTSIISLAAVFLLLIAVAFARDAAPARDNDPVAEATPTPVPTAEPTVEPTPESTPEPTPTPTLVQYMLYTEDLSRDAAEQKCISLGGHLATIKNSDDYERICSLLSGTSAQYVWIGAYRDPDGTIKWPDGGSYDYYAWAPGEPSLSDSYDGAAENYIMLVRQPDGSWLYNDSRENPLANYAQFYSGKIAYICQVG